MCVSDDYVACKWRYPPFVTFILNIKNSQGKYRKDKQLSRK